MPNSFLTLTSSRPNPPLPPNEFLHPSSLNRPSAPFFFFFFFFFSKRITINRSQGEEDVIERAKTQKRRKKEGLQCERREEKKREWDYESGKLKASVVRPASSSRAAARRSDRFSSFRPAKIPKMIAKHPAHAMRVTPIPDTTQLNPTPVSTLLSDVLESFLALLGRGVRKPVPVKAYGTLLGLNDFEGRGLTASGGRGGGWVGF
jgi:hypothetical protein